MIDYPQLLDHLSIGIIVLDEALCVVSWNRWMTEHSLLTRQEAVGRPLAELFPSVVRKGFIDKARVALREGAPVFFTQKMHRRMFPFHTPRSLLDNKLCAMEQTVILSPLTAGDGNSPQLLVSIFDISDWVAFQDQLLASKRELEKLSRIDDLTRIPNRRAIMERLHAELAIHIRKKRPLALILLDIDLFKAVNDTHGHQAGDQVLCQMAKVISKELRGYDVLGRYGGEEFLLILPDTPRQQAMVVGERLRQRVESTPFRFEGESIHLTVSLGISFFTSESGETTTADDLFRIADYYLYQAKNAGRNRVMPAD